MIVAYEYVHVQISHAFLRRSFDNTTFKTVCLQK